MIFSSIFRRKPVFGSVEKGMNPGLAPER